MFYRMMKMMVGITFRCVALLFAVTSVSAVERLNSIDDLRRVDFGQSVPAHSLVLLYWFAHTVEIDNTNVIRLTFNPGNDYGSHYFGNFEELLEPLPEGHRYHTVGNLNEETSHELPDYVRNTRPPYRGENRDRIIFRVRGQRIAQVYITQHRRQSYDSDRTYQITPHLLRQIREFSMAEYNQNLQYLMNQYGSNADISSIRNTWGSLVGLGLFLFIVGERRPYFQEQCRRLQGGRNNEWNVMGLLCALFFLFVICFFIFCAAKLPKV